MYFIGTPTYSITHPVTYSPTPSHPHTCTQHTRTEYIHTHINYLKDVLLHTLHIKTECNQLNPRPKVCHRNGSKFFYWQYIGLLVGENLEIPSSEYQVGDHPRRQMRSIATIYQWLSIPLSWVISYQFPPLCAMSDFVSFWIRSSALNDQGNTKIP
jgi:hypothetical protein